jgi:mRNA interferase RelE/StbE
MPDKITKFIKSLNKKTRERLKARLITLRKDPYKSSNDIKKLQGYKENYYRLRMGDIRIIYTINNNGIDYVDIDYRGNIY